MLLTSGHIEIEVGDQPFSGLRIVNRATGDVLCESGMQLLYVRLPKRVSEPIFLTDLISTESDARGAKWTLADETRTYQADFYMAPAPEGIRFSIDVRAPEPVWMVEWSLEGLALREVIVPALGGQVLTHDMPEGQQLSYKYPFWWNAQFAIGSAGDDAGGLLLRTMQTDPAFKVLRVHKVEDADEHFSLGLGFEADAPITSNDLSAEWYLDGYPGSWQRAADVHRTWMEGSFKLAPYEEHPHLPAWARDINFVLEIWGMRKDRPYPAHTFDDMIERIEAFAKLHSPEQTLLYLPGFAEHGIDSNAPDYDPSPYLGGRPAFKRLIDTAHRLGYHVMIHTNVLAITFTHPLFERFAEHQVVDPFGRLQGWGNDMDGDWLHEPFFAYINPGAEAWGALMESVIGELVTSFDLDAVFLDQTLLAFNDSNGPNFLAGMRRHVERLQRAFPGVLFAGEGLNELILPALPFVQIHGLDSIEEVHGLEGRASWRRIHPVSSYVFGRYTRFTAHLLTRHPSSRIFARQEAAYSELEVLPSLVLYRRSQEIESPEVLEMLERARGLSAGPRRISDSYVES